MQASVISLDNAEFKTQYRGGETPKKLRLDSAYGLCFRICLIHQISEIFRRLSAHKKFDQTRLNIVMERGHKNAPDAARIYDEEATNLQKYDCNLLSGLTFASKDCEPLMLADFLADTTGLRDDKGIISVPNQAFAGIREKAALTHLSFEPGDLSKTKEALIEALNARCASAASLRQRRGGEDV